MTYLQALYGSQYREITARGGDGQKARLNGNLFLAAFIIVDLFVVLALMIHFAPGLEDSVNALFHSAFGESSGKFVGRALAIPLIGGIYLGINATLGSQANFERHIQAFEALPEDQKARANTLLLAPFLSALVGLLALMLLSL